MSKSYLSKITNFIPQNYNYEHLVLESNIESFLFYAVGALDSLFNEINMKMELGITEEKVSLRTIKESLNKKNTEKAKLILNEINKHCTPPSFTTQEISKDQFLSLCGKPKFYHRFRKCKIENNRVFEYKWDRKKSRLWELRKLRNYITHDKILRRIIELDTIGYHRVFFKIPMSDKAVLLYEVEPIENPSEYFSKSFKVTQRFITTIRNLLNK